MVFVFSGRRGRRPLRRKANITTVGDFTCRKVNFTLRSKISPILTSIDGYAATFPTGESKQNVSFNNKKRLHPRFVVFLFCFFTASYFL